MPQYLSSNKMLYLLWVNVIHIIQDILLIAGEAIPKEPVVFLFFPWICNAFKSCLTHGLIFFILDRHCAPLSCGRAFIIGRRCNLKVTSCKFLITRVACVLAVELVW